MPDGAAGIGSGEEQRGGGQGVSSAVSSDAAQRKGAEGGLAAPDAHRAADTFGWALRVARVPTQRLLARVGYGRLRNDRARVGRAAITADPEGGGEESEGY